MEYVIVARDGIDGKANAGAGRVDHRLDDHRHGIIHQGKLMSGAIGDCTRTVCGQPNLLHGALEIFGTADRQDAVVDPGEGMQVAIFGHCRRTNRNALVVWEGGAMGFRDGGG